ncbi:AHH domain-containing protein [Pseudoduganella buxea]|uniref:Uncharacterized protein n=1 Tax=Pseudoduganella buxea TaxID=1949069 RepID=A0A6I3SXP5_9BURK|nr:AHH domain-containing protein [Pseudoduganella buxea]MTV53032.1 hypothetical protein [Pseudoduganella buxea]GGC08001.1 hypothetical protein GCM10011572_32020 [Pseudoduganella buxea]
MAFSLPSDERGHTTKGAYLEFMKSRTESDSHPRHHMDMQAHHAISEKAIFDAKLDDRLADFGYEIDVPENLVFIPSTLQGACLLQVQPHRGNHTARLIKGDDDDSCHPPAYHIMVANRLKAIFPALEEECGDHGTNIAKKTQKALDHISTDIIKKIQHKPREARLTKLYAYFNPGHPRGCGGEDSVTKTGVDTCPVERDHRNQRKGPNQEQEGITYPHCAPYTLEPGK